MASGAGGTRRGSSSGALAPASERLRDPYEELQSPFVWNLLPSLTTRRADSSLWDGHIRRLLDVLQVADSSWTKLVLHLNLCWLRSKRGDYSKARLHLAEADAVLGTLTWSDPEEGGLLGRGERAARHAVEAAWVHLRLGSSRHEHPGALLQEMRAELEQIVRVRDMPRDQQAAVHGLRAACHYFLCVPGEMMGKNMVSSARKANALQPEEAEWLILMGKKPENLETMTPYTAVYSATRHVYYGELLAARVLLRKALDLWPANAFVQMSAAYLLECWQDKLHQQEQHALAERCSIAALKLARDCILVHVVRHLVRPEHSPPFLQRCSSVYGWSADEMVGMLRGSCMVLEGIMCGFVSGLKYKKM